MDDNKPDRAEDEREWHASQYVTPTKNDWQQAEWASWTASSNWSSAQWRNKTDEAPASRSRRKWHDPANHPIQTPDLPPRWCNLPESFEPDDMHYDSNAVMQNVLPRLVLSTKWSRDNGYAGRDIQDIRATELAWDGLQNWSFRLLANGRYVAPEFLRSFKESVYCSAHMRALRARKADGTYLDIEVLAHRLATKNGQPFSTDAEKRAAYEALATWSAQQLESLLPRATSQETMEEMEKLRQEVALLKARPPGWKAQGTIRAYARGAEEEVPKPPKATPKHPLMKYCKDPTDAPHFEQHAPDGHTAAKIKAFITSFNLNQSQEKKYQVIFKELKEVVNSLEETELELLGTYAVEWGLPFGLARNVKNDDLVKLIALATYLSS